MEFVLNTTINNTTIVIVEISEFQYFALLWFEEEGGKKKAREKPKPVFILD